MASHCCRPFGRRVLALGAQRGIPPRLLVAFAIFAVATSGTLRQFSFVSPCSSSRVLRNRGSVPYFSKTGAVMSRLSAAVEERWRIRDGKFEVEEQYQKAVKEGLDNGDIPAVLRAVGISDQVILVVEGFILVAELALIKWTVGFLPGEWFAWLPKEVQGFLGH
mmetsp:Transcript_3568/g.6945  ORF Transcript_3568/g.6945 Transcript_3568/m.6945 type:complete len:164 (-) Transcript_3568:84-575(-)